MKTTGLLHLLSMEMQVHQTFKNDWILRHQVYLSTSSMVVSPS